MTLWSNERVALPAGVRPVERNEAGTAAEFNFWCAVNSLPFQLVRHIWPDGGVEWGVEYAAGEPAETIAYGTGQPEETLAVMLAYAFTAGAEWGRSTPDWRLIATEEPDSEGELGVEPTVMSQVVAPIAGERSPILARLRATDLGRAATVTPPQPETPTPPTFVPPPAPPPVPSQRLTVLAPVEPAAIDDGAIDDEANDDDELDARAPVRAGATGVDDAAIAIPPPVAAAPIITPPIVAPPIAAPIPAIDMAPAPERPAPRPKPSAKVEAPFDLPGDGLLAAPPAGGVQPLDEAMLAANARQLETVLQNFNVRGEIMEVRPGPVVTLYELEPAPGTKSARVIGLAEDIARSMSAVSVRIAVVPGRSVIGIELPNPKRETVYLREMLQTPAYSAADARLPLMLGKNIGGDPVVTDLARMPHLLIAGTTGSGKSVGINGMILSLLFRLPPERCRFIMIDPKMLELSVYEGIPHLLTPVVTDPKKAILALKWAVREMEERYRAMAKVGVRNIDGYNQHLAENPQADGAPLPYIVVVVDEMADLMMVAGKEIEAAIQRLAQMARAAGIHLIMATQRPSVDVITGTIKANFPTRISFMVTSKIDSRTILGDSGAEQLLGQGDMLFMAGGGRITRVHGPFVSDGEVEAVVRHLKTQGAPAYVDGITDEDDDGDDASYDAEAAAIGGDDEVYTQAVQLVLREKKCSISFIQRHLQIGYNRSARIVERMENDGVVGQANHVGKREVLGRARAGEA
jgi:S-DNA-T family DNA segregation ATPase FtsK/SpoIIIE